MKVIAYYWFSRCSSGSVLSSLAAYAALLSFKMVQLPCVRTLKYANLEGAGDCTPRITC